MNGEPDGGEMKRIKRCLMCNVGDILLGIHTQLCCPVDDNAVGLRVEHTV